MCPAVGRILKSSKGKVACGPMQRMLIYTKVLWQTPWADVATVVATAVAGLVAELVAEQVPRLIADAAHLWANPNVVFSWAEVIAGPKVNCLAPVGWDSLIQESHKEV